MKTTAPHTAPPQDVVRRRCGGQPGNRNALKIGAHTAKVRGLRKQTTVARRVLKVLIERAREELDALTIRQAYAPVRGHDIW